MAAAADPPHASDPASAPDEANHTAPDRASSGRAPRSGQFSIPLPGPLRRWTLRTAVVSNTREPDDAPAIRPSAHDSRPPSISPSRPGHGSLLPPDTSTILLTGPHASSPEIENEIEPAPAPVLRTTTEATPSVGDIDLLADHSEVPVGQGAADVDVKDPYDSGPDGAVGREIDLDDLELSDPPHHRPSPFPDPESAEPESPDPETPGPEDDESTSRAAESLLQNTRGSARSGSSEATGRATLSPDAPRSRVLRGGRVLVVGQASLADEINAITSRPVEHVASLFDVIGESAVASVSAAPVAVVASGDQMHDDVKAFTVALRRVHPALVLVAAIEADDELRRRRAESARFDFIIDRPVDRLEFERALLGAGTAEVQSSEFEAGGVADLVADLIDVDTPDPTAPAAFAGGGPTIDHERPPDARPSARADGDVDADAPDAPSDGEPEQEVLEPSPGTHDVVTAEIALEPTDAGRPSSTEHQEEAVNQVGSDAAESRDMTSANTVSDIPGVENTPGDHRTTSGEGLRGMDQNPVGNVTNTINRQAPKAEPVRGPDGTAMEMLECLLHDPPGLNRLACGMIARESGADRVEFLPAGSEVASGSAVRVAYGDHVFGHLIAEQLSPDARAAWADWLARWLAADRRMHELHRWANIDQLTGAWNRRFFDSHLEAVLARANVEQRSVSVMLFDLDDFKRFNDEYGHAAGDEILQATVRLLGSVIRPADRVCRLGGDEFAVIFYDPQGERRPGSRHPHDVYAATARFRRQVEAQRFPSLGTEAAGRLTISAGLATFPDDGATAAALLGTADQRLLESKRAGKNVITYGPPASDDRTD